MNTQEIEEIKAWEQRIHDEYSEIFSKNGTKPSFIMDGAIAYKQYAEAEIKILFLNREPNDEDEDYWLNRILQDQIINKEPIFSNNHNFVPNLYGAFCVVNLLDNYDIKNKNEQRFCKIIDDQVNKNGNIGDFMLSTSYINLKKIPGGSKTNDGKLVEVLGQGWDVIKKQILGLNPTIIVGGNIEKYLDASDDRINLEWVESIYLNPNKSIPALHIMHIDDKEYPILDLYHPSYNCNHDKYSWKDLYDLLMKKGEDYWQARFNQPLCIK